MLRRQPADFKPRALVKIYGGGGPGESSLQVIFSLLPLNEVILIKYIIT